MRHFAAVTSVLCLFLGHAACTKESSAGDSARADSVQAVAPESAAPKTETGGATQAAPAVVLSPPGREPVRVVVELAQTPAERQRGMMFRERLDPDAGMLFLFEEPQQLTFWMRNTFVPLDMIFIEPDLTVLGVVENATPRTDTTRGVPGISQYVLEVNAGFARKHGIGPGTPVRFEHTGVTPLPARADKQLADTQPVAPPPVRPLRTPNAPDPLPSGLDLGSALKGVKGKGDLAAEIRTTQGTFRCALYPDKAPLTVANFVGLARGLRPFWDAREAAWVSRPYYDGTTFHRVIPGFMIQGGDYLGDGSGTIGYDVRDEVHASLKHDKAGQLCMANRGPHTNGAQFFITDGPTPHLDGSFTIFGQCEPTDLVSKIARVRQSGAPHNRPLEPVTIEQVTISRNAARASR